MIIGKDSNLYYCSLDEKLGSDKFKEVFSEIICKLSSSGKKLVIICDLYFGCPNISAVECISSVLETGSYRIITGANLPMMLELCLANRSNPNDLDLLVKTALTKGKEGITEFKIKKSDNKHEDVL